MTQEKIKFTKMHGAGNDYIYVNTIEYEIPNPGELAKKWSAYHTGIGSDGLVLIGKAKNNKADFSMRIFNADGSEAMMCGNASRCIGKYLYEKKLTSNEVIRLETLSGVKILNLNVEDGKVSTVRVDMSEPSFDVFSQCTAKESYFTIETIDKTFEGTFVSMGNPHFVTFVDDVENFNIKKYGSILEFHKVFPQRANIEFAQIVPSGIRMRVWERGSGITLACGTGACATAVAAAKTLGLPRESHIIMDGGALDITWDKKDNHVYMEGGAEFVFDGEIMI